MNFITSIAFVFFSKREGKNEFYIALYLKLEKSGSGGDRVDVVTFFYFAYIMH